VPPKPALLLRISSSVFIILSGMLNWRVFRRPKPRAPAKKVVKSSEFIDDEAEEL
jgi:hypothetical protein